MPIKTLVLPEVRDITEDVVASIRKRGYDLEVEAQVELGELVLAGFRRLQEERILDLDAADPQRQKAVEEAMTNLHRFTDSWLRAEAGTKRLTLDGYEKARRKFCPVYPFR